MDALILRLFLHVWSAKSQSTPKLRPMADDAITRSGMEGLGSLVYICVRVTVYSYGSQWRGFNLYREIYKLYLKKLSMAFFSY